MKKLNKNANSKKKKKRPKQSADFAVRRHGWLDPRDIVELLYWYLSGQPLTTYAVYKRH